MQIGGHDINAEDGSLMLRTAEACNAVDGADLSLYDGKLLADEFVTLMQKFGSNRHALTDRIPTWVRLHVLQLSL